MQQWSALGQFAGPPLVAWVAVRAGGWQWTWVTTGALCLVGLLLTSRLAALSRSTPPNSPQRTTSVSEAGR
jgi:MFS transporter, CP family, cyanate transporter